MFIGSQSVSFRYYGSSHWEPATASWSCCVNHPKDVCGGALCRAPRGSVLDANALTIWATKAWGDIPFGVPAEDPGLCSCGAHLGADVRPSIMSLNMILG